MLPNWIYYLIGKKSGGGSPAPTPTSLILPNGIKFGDSILESYPDYFDFSEIINARNLFRQNYSLKTFSGSFDSCTDMGGLFYSDNKLESVTLNNITNVTVFSTAFQGCSKLTSVTLGECSPTNCVSMFTSCSSLVNLPVFNLNLTNGQIQNMVSYCSSLSNESIQNLLKMVNAIQQFPYTKTLKYLGLTQSQATIATSFTTEWNALVAKGWTTGY